MWRNWGKSSFNFWFINRAQRDLKIITSVYMQCHTFIYVSHILEVKMKKSRKALSIRTRKRLILLGQSWSQALLRSKNCKASNCLNHYIINYYLLISPFLAILIRPKFILPNNSSNSMFCKHPWYSLNNLRSEAVA